MYKTANVGLCFPLENLATEPTLARQSRQIIHADSIAFVRVFFSHVNVQAGSRFVPQLVRRGFELLRRLFPNAGIAVRLNLLKVVGALSRFIRLQLFTRRADLHCLFVVGAGTTALLTLGGFDGLVPVFAGWWVFSSVWYPRSCWPEFCWVLV